MQTEREGVSMDAHAAWGGCSSVATGISSLSHFYSLVTMSGVASTPTLSDKFQHPTFLRTTSSFLDFVPGFLGLLDFFQWRRVALVDAC